MLCQGQKHLHVTTHQEPFPMLGHWAPWGMQLWKHTPTDKISKANMLWVVEPQQTSSCIYTLHLQCSWLVLFHVVTFIFKTTAGWIHTLGFLQSLSGLIVIRPWRLSPQSRDTFPISCVSVECFIIQQHFPEAQIKRESKLVFHSSLHFVILFRLTGVTLECYSSSSSWF